MFDRTWRAADEFDPDDAMVRDDLSPDEAAYLEELVAGAIERLRA